ncbi:hypothetical protein SAMN05216226_11056 [Halovenus aranensis]|uniref:Lipoprotein n=1 Tax=Halovenus aranensis TaxID=890420 RepID=A0A1G8X1V9_9EURY|nr:hypothetical protein [Halovenus aranensis]SDJ84327.1 hypothetical protein SAMN05216226_11056 [Halovenus aranensis]
MRRRALLSATVGMTVGSAGCLASIRDSNRQMVQLGWFGVHNADPKSSHTFTLIVERDGNVVHESSHDVDAAEYSDPGVAMDGAVAECTWKGTSGDYSVRVRRDGEEETEKSVSAFAAERGVECVVAEAEYENYDVTSDFLDGKRLSISLREGCDNDGYAGKCSVTQE